MTAARCSCDRRQAPGNRHSGGFTLVEVLVAFTVLSIMAVAVQQAVMSSVTGVTRAQAKIEAELVARTLMSGPLGAGPDAFRARSGRMNGLGWTVRFERLNLEAGDPDRVGDRAPAWFPMRMVIDVGGVNGAPPVVSIKTVRLARIGP